LRSNRSIFLGSHRRISLYGSRCDGLPVRSTSSSVRSTSSTTVVSLSFISTSACHPMVQLLRITRGTHLQHSNPSFKFELSGGKFGSRLAGKGRRLLSVGPRRGDTFGLFLSRSDIYLVRSCEVELHQVLKAWTDGRTDTDNGHKFPGIE
jgi:hypothetical protein